MYILKLKRILFLCGALGFGAQVKAIVEANADILSLCQGAAIVDVLANDSSTSGKALSVTLGGGSCSGSIIDLGDGVMDVSQALGSADACSFEYTVSDGGTSQSATVTLLRDSNCPGDTAPVIQMTATPPSINAGESVTISWTISNAVAGSCLGYINGVQTGVPLDLPSDTYVDTPEDTTTYRIDCAWSGGVASASVVVTVIPAADLVANPDPDASDPTSLTFTTPAATYEFRHGILLANDVPPTGTEINAFSQPSEGTLEDVNGSPIGHLRYIPPPGFVGGEVTFTYTMTVYGGVDVSNTAQVTLVIPPPPAVANDDGPYATPYLTNLDIPHAWLLQNDDGGTNPTIADFPAHPADGSLVFHTNSVEYQPRPGFSGPDSFQYRLRNQVGTLSNAATVYLNVTPVAVEDGPIFVECGQVLTIEHSTLLANDGGSSLIISAFPQQPLHGTLDTTNPGVIVYQPDSSSPPYTGPDQFTYRARDASNQQTEPAAVYLDLQCTGAGQQSRKKKFWLLRQILNGE